MRSSTFSSDRAWIASWLVAIVLVAAGIGAWEAYWRACGFVPSVNDDAGLWALARKRATDLGADAVVLVGSSRMQMDIHRGAFSQATGWGPAVQLAVVRGPSVPVLRSLAEDPDFRATVICEVNPVVFFARTPRLDGLLKDYAAHYEEFTIADEVEQRLRMFVQERLVTRLSSLSPENVWDAFERNEPPRPGYNDVVTRDRDRYGDYARFEDLELANRSNARLMAETTPKMLRPWVFDIRMRAIERMVDSIQERGGKVVFVHLPTALHVRAHEARWFPRRRFWDRFAETSSAVVVNSLDHPELAGFRPPDGEHLGAADAVRFSRAFGELLVELGVAPGPAETEARR